MIKGRSPKHAVIEDNPSLSLRKFVKYNGPILLDKLKKREMGGKQAKKGRHKTRSSRKTH